MQIQEGLGIRAALVKHSMVSTRILLQDPQSLNGVHTETLKCLSNCQIKLSNKTQTTASALLSCTAIYHPSL